jgi:hypothetical protein
MDQLLFDLPPAFIQSLLGSASHLGLQLRSLDLPEYVGFNSTESISGKPRLVVAYSLPAPSDFNSDGVVDSLDLNAWRAGFGTLAATADADDDGDADGRDLLLWQRNMGLGSVIAASAAVPEPRTSAFLLAGLAAAVPRAQRLARRRHALR